MSFIISPYQFFSTSSTDPSFANVSLLMHFDGTDGSTTFTDHSANAFVPMLIGGNVQIDTAQSKFGGASCLFDGTGDYMFVTDNTTPADRIAKFEFGTGDFTVETWVRLAGASTAFQTFICFGDENSVNGSTFSWALEKLDSGNGGQFRFFFYDNTAPKPASQVFYQVVGTTVPNLNQWYHLAATRASGTMRLFVDGVQEASAAANAEINLGSGRKIIIGQFINGTRNVNGHLDDIRVTKGVARYTANFTPPTAAFPNS